MTAYDWADSSQISVADPDYLEALDPTPVKPKARRGTSNGNSSGSAEDRRRRRKWLIETYRADVDADIHLRSTDGKLWEVPLGEGHPACRCFRCGRLMAEGFQDLLTVDRIIPGCKGGTYRRNNIRPECRYCASSRGGGQRADK